VLAVLKGFDKVDAAKVSPTAHFYNDLGLDSLDAVEVRAPPWSRVRPAPAPAAPQWLRARGYQCWPVHVRAAAVGGRATVALSLSTCAVNIAAYLWAVVPIHSTSPLAVTRRRAAGQARPAWRRLARGGSVALRHWPPEGERARAGCNGLASARMSLCTSQRRLARSIGAIALEPALACHRRRVAPRGRPLT
jgi:hypothetical protein